MLPPQFCPTCGAANEPERTSCLACGRSILSASYGPNEQHEGLLHGRYRLGTLLGAGGFSTVYRARDIQAAREVAIKQISLGGLSTEEVIEATDTFNREVSLLSVLHHPQVPRLYDHFHDPDHWYLVLEYLEGPTLESYLETRIAQGRPFQVEEVLAMALHLCTVLDYLHTRQPPIVFRDLKPGNIIRASDGTLRLIDFGIARQYRPGQARDTQPLGSPGYAAPEQYGKDQSTPRTDIYSLGVLLRSLLSGQDPSERSQGFAFLRVDHPFELRMLLNRMCSTEASARPATIQEVARELETIRSIHAFRSGRPVWVPPSPQPAGGTRGQIHVQLASSSQSATSPSAKRFLTRRRVFIGLSVLTVVIGGGIWWQDTASHSPYIYRGHTDVVNALAWSPNGMRIASASDDGTVQVWSASDGSEVFIYRGHADPVQAVAWSPDGKRIASVSSEEVVRIWNATDGSGVIMYSGGNTLAWSPDGTRIASASNENSNVTIRDARDGSHVFTYRGHYAQVTSIAWSPDGKRIASGSDDMSVQVWNAHDGSNAVVNRDHTNVVSAVAWSPDSLGVASASRDTTVRVSNGPERNAVYAGHTAAVNTVGWSSYFRFIASGSDDQTVQIWLDDGEDLILTYRGHTDAVSTLMWSPDGKRIASGSWDHTVQVWAVRRT